MNKKDLMWSILLNVCALILLIEHLCGLELAFSFFIVAVIVSCIAHIYIISKYAICIEYEFPKRKSAKR